MSQSLQKQTRALSPIDEIRQELNKMSTQFKMALPPNVTPEKFIRVTMTALQNDPTLLGLDRKSLYNSAMKCAQDGLLPDGREAALVKFGDKAQYMPMIGGILKKVRNSGELASITSQIVHKNDKFRYWVDTDGEHLDHEPLLFGDRGERIGVYALAKTKDGAVYIEPMTVTDVMAVKNVSRSKDRGPWAGPFETEMWRKTAIRRLSKRLPMSTDLEEIIRRDDELYDLKEQRNNSKAEELSNKLAEINSNDAYSETGVETETDKNPENFENFNGSTIETTGKTVVAPDPKVVK